MMYEDALKSVSWNSLVNEACGLACDNTLFLAED